MKAVQIRQYGGKDVLEINQNAPKPIAGDGQVLVEVHAASINPVDWKIRSGYLKEMAPLTMPATLGGDVCGIVAAVGTSVSTLKVGDRLYGYASLLSGGSGSFAEFVAAKLSTVALAPKKSSVIDCRTPPGRRQRAPSDRTAHEASARPKSPHSWRCGRHRQRGHPGSQVHRAYVATTARADDRAYVHELGADEVIDYQQEGFEDKLKNFDAVFDTIGGETTEKNHSKCSGKAGCWCRCFVSLSRKWHRKWAWWPSDSLPMLPLKS